VPDVVDVVQQFEDEVLVAKEFAAVAMSKALAQLELQL